VVRRRIEKRTAYSPPPPLDRALSPTPTKTGTISAKKPSSKRHARALAPPPPTIFKFPPFPITFDDDEALLNYATLATQDILTPNSAGSNRNSVRRSVNYSVPLTGQPVEYAKIDELATQAARKAVISRRNEIRTVSDGEQSIDTLTSVPCQPSSVKGRRPCMLKRSLLRRRFSFASLSGV